MEYAHVTAITNVYPQFQGIPARILEYASLRGTIVHKSCEAYCRGLFVAHLPDETKGYVTSFKRWFDRYVKEVYLVEDRLCDHSLCITGQLDLLCRLIDDTVLIVDFKTPVLHSPTWPLQIAAYRHLANLKENNAGWPHVQCGATLQLHKEGKEAKANLYEDTPMDFKHFISALSLYRYLEQKGENHA